MPANNRHRPQASFRRCSPALRPRSRRVLLVLGVLVLLGAGVWPWAQAATPDSPFATERTAPVKTPALKSFVSKHYDIQSDLPKSQVRVLSRHMDQVFEAYRQRFGSLPQRGQGRMSLYLFARRQTYQDFLSRHQINAPGTGGIFFITPQVKALATFIEDQPRSRVFATLQHEGLHQFVFNYIGPGLPIWANEGMAQYFETALMIRGKLMLGLTDPFSLWLVQDALAAQTTVPLAQVLAISDDDWRAALFQDEKHANLLYAQAWAMIYFLVHGDGGKYLPSLNQYLLLVSQGTDGRDAFAQTFGRDAGAFEKAWRQYILDLQADSLSMATEHMSVLAHAMLSMRKDSLPLPQNLEDLRAYMRTHGYVARRQIGSVERQYQAADDTLYSYQLPTGAKAEFKLLEPAGRHLLPRIAAPGLDPEPTLIWFQAGGGQLAYDFEYR
ncbi:MAG: DUF1570 domain-containing protein [Phycisphaeraceae bacterium]|nr:DUF1570 domain-containing protein [Phycisphaeraceae bacterium]